MRDYIVLVPIVSALIIYWARIAELNKRRDVVSGEIRQNLTLRLFVAVGSVMLIGSIAEQLWTRPAFNAHGTATAANDVAESFAIQQSFNGRALPVSSTKPVTGHLLGAAGALETVITALSIHHRAVPLTLNFDSPAPGCELDYVRGGSRSAAVHVALNLSCGFGGTNSCLALGSM